METQFIKKRLSSKEYFKNNYRGIKLLASCLILSLCVGRLLELHFPLRTACCLLKLPSFVMCFVQICSVEIVTLKADEKQSFPIFSLMLSCFFLLHKVNTVFLVSNTRHEIV